MPRKKVISEKVQGQLRLATDLADSESVPKRADGVTILRTYRQMFSALPTGLAAECIDYAQGRSWRSPMAVLAGAVSGPKGGKRPGAGRPRHVQKAKNRTLRLRDKTWALLLRLAKARGVSRQVLVSDLAEAEALRVKEERNA